MITDSLRGAVFALFGLGLLAAGPARGDRGDLVSWQAVENPFDASSNLFHPELVDQAIADFGLTGLPPTTFRLAAYRLRYATVDAFGNPGEATGLAVIPIDAVEPPTVCLLHGTETHDDSVPSRSYVEVEEDDDPEYLLLLAAFAGGGYLAVAPDYIGMGDSPGFHPYHHADSEAAGAVDAIRAARQLAVSRGSAPGADLFLTGYSQGAHATLATHREIETNHSAEFSLVASVPGAGAYDLIGAQLQNLFRNPAEATPLYLAYLVHSMNEVYDLWPDLSGIFKSPYDAAIPDLFDGTKEFEEVIRALPPTSQFSKWVHHPTAESFRDHHPDLIAVTQENSVSHWLPEAPILFLYADADRDVYPANTHVAYAHMISRASPVRRQRIGSHLDHESASYASVGKARAYIDSFYNATTLDYDFWKSSQDIFHREQIAQGDSLIGPMADPNGDGIVNLMCYAFGLDPTLPSAVAMPGVSITSEGRLAITVIQRRNAWLNVAAEISESLTAGSWRSTPSDFQASAPLSMGDGFEQITFTSETPMDVADQQFVRVRITTF